ncbi:hypothetical protein [Neorhizobium huautlense]|uniref:hypothetical protein n=1 Tax=Neorhizobium huautlense TaxID=67774 RepID=UPI001FDED15D|nr:hypothetical protein [Neorhizobium huautlense]
MNASDYLKRSALYRKLDHGPYQEFARAFTAKMSNEGLGRQCTWRSLSLFRDLMDWHIGNGHAPQDLSEVHVDHFLEHRFKQWKPDSGGPIGGPALAFSAAGKRLNTSRRAT